MMPIAFFVAARADALAAPRCRVLGGAWLVFVCASVLAACGDDSSDAGGSAGSGAAGSGGAAAVGGNGGALSSAGHGSTAGGGAGRAGTAADGGGRGGSTAAGTGGMSAAAGTQGDAGAMDCSITCEADQHCELVMVTCIQPPCPPAQPMCVDDPAPRGGTCGTRGAHACPSAQYCDYVRGKCGSDDSGGTCQDVPAVCNDIAMPVCGCDDKTYANACQAAVKRVSVKSDGACP